MESLLLSTLQSFYNQTTFNQILLNFNSSVPLARFNALNPLQNSSFSLHATLETLVEKLFVESWLETWNYSSYFSQCQPRYCRYVLNQRPAALYIITSLLGLYGGLSVVLHLIIPRVVEFFLKKRERQHSNMSE
jgi:hypothetical protein